MVADDVSLLHTRFKTVFDHYFFFRTKTWCSHPHPQWPPHKTVASLRASSQLGSNARIFGARTAAPKVVAAGVRASAATVAAPRVPPSRRRRQIVYRSATDDADAADDATATERRRRRRATVKHKVPGRVQGVHVVSSRPPIAVVFAFVFAAAAAVAGLPRGSGPRERYAPAAPILDPRPVERRVRPAPVPGPWLAAIAFDARDPFSPPPPPQQVDFAAHTLSRTTTFTHHPRSHRRSRADDDVLTTGCRTRIVQHAAAAAAAAAADSTFEQPVRLNGCVRLVTGKKTFSPHKPIVFRLRQDRYKDFRPCLLDLPPNVSHVHKHN